MNNSDIQRAIEGWATRIPLVGKVWLFGSRARGTHSEDSDVDIACELDGSSITGTDASGGFATWMFESKEWKRQIEQELGIPVDLQIYMGSDTPTIQYALAESSVLLYEKLNKPRRNELPCSPEGESET